jgi:hypothetical protein
VGPWVEVESDLRQGLDQAFAADRASRADKQCEGDDGRTGVLREAEVHVGQEEAFLPWQAASLRQPLLKLSTTARTSGARSGSATATAKSVGCQARNAAWDVTGACHTPAIPDRDVLS